MSASTVLLSFEGSLARLELNRPDKLNALSPEMLTLLEDAIGRIEANQGCRAVVVSAAGDRAFCVGADIKAWSTLAPIDMWRTWTRNGHRVFDRLANLRQPTIAAIDGLALGGGLELALACDLRIASPRTALALPEVTIATVPGWGGTQRLSRLVGPARAKQMVLTGERVDAATACQWGLVNELAEDPRARAHAVAERIAGNAPVSVQIAKQILDSFADASRAAASLEMLAGAAAAATDDAREGIAALTERRPARFAGG